MEWHEIEEGVPEKDAFLFVSRIDLPHPRDGSRAMLFPDTDITDAGQPGAEIAGEGGDRGGCRCRSGLSRSAIRHPEAAIDGLGGLSRLSDGDRHGEIMVGTRISTSFNSNVTLPSDVMC